MLLIQRYSREEAEFEGSIKESDKVCCTSYQSHLVIINFENETIATDNGLL